MDNSDMMWFCVGCREKVERNIITDRKIEEKCKEMAKKFDERLKTIEKSLKEKCNKEEVLAVVREEMDKRSSQVNVEEPIVTADKEKRTGSNVQEVLDEIQERKNREANIVIYGVQECESSSRDSRMQHDIEHVVEITEVCDAKVDESDISRVFRLGKYDKEKTTQRPLLVKFKKTESKTKIFKGIKKTSGDEKFKDIRVANDLTKTERENDRKMHDQAKDMSKNSGDYTYRVRGPPWARRIAKIRVVEGEEEVE